MPVQSVRLYLGMVSDVTGGYELPVDERRLARARRAVEKAAAILAEPDDRDWAPTD